MTVASDSRTLLASLEAAPRAERVQRLVSAGPVDELLVALGDEAERLALVQVSRALAVSELVIELADAVGAAAARARARRARAQALCYAGRFTEALAVCREAVGIAEEAQERVEAARARLASLHALGELGRYDEAVGVGEEAREMLLAAGQPRLAGRADLNLGVIHQNRNDPARALAHLDRAARALADEPLLLGYIENNRGEALLLLDDFQGAAEAFTRAREVAEQARADLAAAIAEGNLADLAARRGALDQALRHFERARRRLERDVAGGHLARLIMEQAEALETLGMPGEALAGYDEALPALEDHGLAWEAGRAWMGRGKALLKLERVSEARAALDQAAARFERLGDSVMQARVDLLRAELLALAGQTDQARQVLHRARQALRERPVDAALADEALARLELRRGELEAARRHLQCAAEQVEPLGLAPVLAGILHVRGQLALRSGQTDKAIADLQAAVGQIERVRGTLQADRFRVAFLGHRLAVYEDLLRAWLARPDIPLGPVFDTIERARSRSLLDLASGALEAAAAGSNGEDPEERELTERMARLRAELNVLYSRLADVRTRASPSASTWRAAVEQRERALDELERRITSARGVNGLYARPASLETVQRCLPVGAGLIEYFAAAGRLLALILTRDRARLLPDLAPLDEITPRVQRLQFQLGRAARPGATDGVRARGLLEDVRRELGTLYRRLIEPLESDLDELERLVVVPYGVLHAVPYPALWDGRRYVIERWELSLAPSASLFCMLTAPAGRAAGGDGAGTSLVVGVSDELAPGIEEEARRVAGALPASRLLLGPQATVEAVLAAAAEARVVHLACHGHFDACNPGACGLRLYDRRLTVRDIYGKRLRAELVTLSGCDTGRSLVGGGDELMGLVRALLAAGASSLLVSLWALHDESATRLMCTFYERLVADRQAGGAGRAAALRAAQLEAIGQEQHPLYWAPFILTGGV